MAFATARTCAIPWYSPLNATLITSCVSALDTLIGSLSTRGRKPDFSIFKLIVSNSKKILNNINVVVSKPIEIGNHVPIPALRMLASGRFLFGTTDRPFGRTNSTTPSNKHTSRMIYTSLEECGDYDASVPSNCRIFLANWRVWPAGSDKRKAPSVSLTRYVKKRIPVR